MNKTMKITVLAILMTGCAVSRAGLITYAAALKKVNKAITDPKAKDAAQNDLEAIAIDTNKSTLRTDGITIDMDETLVDAIISKYVSSDTKTKSETSKTSSSTSTTTTQQSSSESKEKKEQCEFGDCWALPKDLQGKGIYYLAVNNQKDSSCGYHVVANSWAIQNLFEAKKKKKITAEAIDNEKGPMDGSSSIDNEQMMQMAKELYVKNFYILGIGQSKEGKKVYVTNQNTTTSLETTFKNFQANKKGFAFFGCHTGGNHWFLIAAINDGSKTNLLCLDTLNTPIKATASDARYTYLHYFYDSINSKQADTSDDEALARALQESLR